MIHLKTLMDAHSDAYHAAHRVLILSEVLEILLRDHSAVSKIGRENDQLFAVAEVLREKCVLLETQIETMGEFI